MANKLRYVIFLTLVSSLSLLANSTDSQNLQLLSEAHQAYVNHDCSLSLSKITQLLTSKHCPTLYSENALKLYKQLKVNCKQIHHAYNLSDYITKISFIQSLIATGYARYSTFVVRIKTTSAVHVKTAELSDSLGQSMMTYPSAKINRELNNEYGYEQQLKESNIVNMYSGARTGPLKDGIYQLRFTDSKNKQHSFWVIIWMPEVVSLPLIKIPASNTVIRTAHPSIAIDLKTAEIDGNYFARLYQLAHSPEMPVWETSLRHSDKQFTIGKLKNGKPLKPSQYWLTVVKSIPLQTGKVESTTELVRSKQFRVSY